MGVKFVRFWPLHGFLWVSDLSDLYGFLTASRPICAASVRVHQLGAFLVVRPLFVGVFLGVHSGFMGRNPREFVGSSRGQHQGAGLGFWAVYHARGCMRPNKPV